MTYVELPLWLVIVFVVVFVLVTIHLGIGDLIAKVLYRKINEHEQKQKQELENKDE